MNIPLLPQDKANHFFYGAVCASAGSIVTLLIVWAFWLAGHKLESAVLAAAIVGLVCSASAGIAKEYRDDEENDEDEKAGRPLSHEVSRQDIAATMLGGLAATAPLFLIGLMIYKGMSHVV